MNTTDIGELKKQLRQYNLKPNFTYGQNFLVDEIVLEDIVDAAGLSPKDRVLEIGPGLGSLTRKLCRKAGFVLAVEKDPKFLPALKSIKRDFSHKFRFEIADILEYDFQKFFSGLESGNEAALPAFNAGAGPASGSGFFPYKVVANIPYYITGKILEMLLAAKHKPVEIILLTQKEVAERVAAKKGEMSLLGASVQLYGFPEIVRHVPAASFYPAPKVSSAILRIRVFSRARFPVANEKKFFQVLKACFSGKRKQLHNTLAGNLGLEKQKVFKVLKELGIDPKTRPQDLTLEQWAELAEKINP